MSVGKYIFIFVNEVLEGVSLDFYKNGAHGLSRLVLLPAIISSPFHASPYYVDYWTTVKVVNHFPL